MKTVYHTATPEETEKIGSLLAKEILEDGNAPRFVALFGDLGVGKTAFVRGVASVIAPGAVIRSPTFALVHEHLSGKIPLFHFDLYRITGEDDLYSIGFDDYLARKGLCLTEWSENIESELPAHYYRVTIRKCGKENGREITILKQ